MYQMFFKPIKALDSVKRAPNVLDVMVNLGC